MNYTYLGTTIEYDITYKNRKSIGIAVDYYGNVKVSAPKKTEEKLVVLALETQWEAIQSKVQEMKERFAETKKRLYQSGEEFLYLGVSYPIYLVETQMEQKDLVVFEENRLCIYVKNKEEEAIRAAIKRFYYKQCKGILSQRIKEYQSHFKMKPRGFSISDNNKTWGTCNSNRELTFNWRLAMAPTEVIDYIVVHEMCHMVHLNHDRSFWRLVGKICPDYEKARDWLAFSLWKMTI